MAAEAEVPIVFYPGSEYAPEDIRETAELLSLVFMGGYESGNDGSTEYKIEEWRASELLEEWSDPEMHFTFRVDRDEPPPGVAKPLIHREAFEDDGIG